jgi:hypothetical protein
MITRAELLTTLGMLHTRLLFEYNLHIITLIVLTILAAVNIKR